MAVMTMQELKKELLSDSVKNVILDTDAYNEIDDQYTIAYTMLSKDRVNLLSINAAPFLNSRSTSAGDGMEKSYNEIFNIMRLVDENAKIPVYRGSTEFMTDVNVPVESDAANNIINTVMNSKETVYIVAIGAITNVASAILKCPEIVEKAVVIWLGGHALHWQDTKEFNLKQDIPAAQVIFNSGIAFVQIPCNGVCTEFVTTVPEINYYMKGKNALCDYLCEITAAYNRKGVPAWSKIVWDVTAAAAIVKPETEDMVIIPTPYVTCDGRYAFDAARHPYIYIRRIRRDPLYADLFEKLANK
jgi:inosine-uridine nucleoside N-ribohydrolase